MTGQFAHKLGFQDLEVDEYSNFSLPLERTPALLPARLRALGYKTYGLGKWNLGHCNARYLPWARGFDSFLGYFSGGVSYTTHQAATFVHGDAEYALYDLVEGKSPSKSAGAAAAADTLRVGARHAGTYDTQLYGAKAVALVREHAAAGGGDDDGAGQKNVSAPLPVARAPRGARRPRRAERDAALGGEPREPRAAAGRRRGERRARRWRPG